MNTTKKITLQRVLGIFLTGLVCGIQLALYMYDYYDDGIADYKSLLIGIVMVILSLAFILYTFRGNKEANPS